jgi:hypothetical protein
MKHQVTNEDLPWMIKLPEKRWLEMFCLAAGQVFLVQSKLSDMHVGQTIVTARPLSSPPKTTSPPRFRDDLDAIPEIRPLAVSLDTNGKAICPCSVDFHGHHYVNSDAGWNDHIKQRSHINWRRSEHGLPLLVTSPATMRAQEIAKSKRNKRRR